MTTIRLRQAAGVLLALSSFPVIACGPTSGSGRTEVPASAAHTVVSLQGIDCQSCGMSVVEALQKSDGVFDVSFDKDTAEVAVAYDAAVVGPPQFIAIAQDLGYRASEGPGEGAYIPEVEFPPALDVEQISKEGEAVDIDAALAAGKVTVVDFHAIWCGPCRKVDRHMLSVLRERDDVALRKVNVVDWDSAVAQQHLQGVESLPYILVYDRSGKRVAKIAGLDLDGLDAAIAKGARR